MSRRALRQNDSSVTLFPFLAVLICTMGALIVLLVVLVQQARTTPASTAAKMAAEPESRPTPVSTGAFAAPAPPPFVAAPREDPERKGVPATPSADDLAALQQEAEDLAWQAEMLTESREATRQRLKEQRLELSKLEDQSEQLRQQLALLESQAQELLDAEQDKSAGNETTAADLAEVQAAILRAEEELARVHEAAREKRRKFAVVPYHGRHATRQRPIYIECRGDRIEIQPEGVLLVPEDFQRPIGPANPLAMALRAAREYLMRAGLTAVTGEPYPLLLVRPEGAQAYAACRAALDGWDDEFGYELIDGQTELAFHPPDEGLARTMQDAIERAREQRRFELVQEMAPTFRASRNGGGFVREGGRRRAASAAAPGDTSGSDMPVSGGPAAGGPGSGGPPVRGLAAAGNIPGSEGAAAATDAPPGANSGEGHDGGLQLGALDDPRGSGISPELSRDSAFPTGNPSGMSAGPAGASSRGEYGNYFEPGAGGPAGGRAAQSGTQGVPSGAGAVSQQTPGSQTPPAGGWNSPRGAEDFAPQPPAGGGEFGGSSTAGGPAHSMSLMQSSTGQSLARTRGRNWALPNAADGAIGISRPINVVCTPQSLRINPELGVAAASQDISFSSSTQAAVQPFVSAIWRRIESWGIAGPGVYWKPLVQVAVQPGAEQRFDQLQALLQGSGLELIRR